MTDELNGRRKPRRDADSFVVLTRGSAVQWKTITHICRECGRDGTQDVQLFVLALNGGRSQLRGYWHRACFKKVQHDIVAATRAWVVNGDEPRQSC